MTTMSKLKRKKPAVENCRPEKFIINKSNESLCRGQESSGSKTSTGSSASDAVSWWERSDLSDVERIWALTLKALCPTLQSHQEECIPPLPPPSSTLSQRAPVEKVGDWKWRSPDDVIDLPDLPAPSFLIRPPPVIDPTSHPPAVEDTVESRPTAPTDQENHKSSPNQEGELVNDLQTTEQRHLEGLELLDKQSEKLGPAGKVSQCRKMEHHANASVKMSSSLKGPPSYEAGEGFKPNPKSPSVHKYKQDSLALTGGQGRKGERSMSDSQVVAGGSSADLRTEPGARGSKSRLGTKQGAGGSGSGLRTQSGGSGSELRTKSGAEEPGSELGTKSRGSGLNLDTKPGAEGSKSGLECCPMCLMPFPAGFSQMECDGHLAQCLAEMNEDIVW